MNKEEFYLGLQDKFAQLIAENNLDLDELSVATKGLSTQEAIGKTLRRDFPIIKGKEVMLQANYKGHSGQAFTSTPVEFVGSLRQVLEADIVHDDLSLSLFIATLNAVMSYLGLIEGTIHCRNEGPELCGEKYVEYLQQTYGSDPKILLVGYQAALVAHLSQVYDLHCVDLT